MYYKNEFLSFYSEIINPFQSIELKIEVKFSANYTTSYIFFQIIAVTCNIGCFLIFIKIPFLLITVYRDFT